MAAKHAATHRTTPPAVHPSGASVLQRENGTHLKRIVISSAVLAIAIAGAGVASAEKPENPGSGKSGFKVTGGGQIISDDQEAAGGPGDTVGFNAHEVEGDDPASTGDDNDAATGQFQYNPHGGAQNPDQNQPANEKFHGVVTCLISGQEAVDNETAEEETPANYEEELVAGMARFGGYVRTKDDTIQYFTVDVSDNGQGGDAEDDLILVRLTDEPCADNPEDEDTENQQDLFELGRGNVKIHNNPDGAASPAALAIAHAKMIKMAAGL